ncbi:MAG TPA: glycosyltransferase family 4 protein [Verrucomicrobiae bacterium]|jgi:glycosyltransferase involved in cell wall biosynthesis|nr:glycosyltransferase family 4 protein [Verrucomicrobiae bacterium]
MKIGIVSPFMPHALRDLMDTDSQKLLPGIRGITANPVMPLARAWHQRGHDISVFCLDQSVATTQILRGERLVIYVLPKRRSRYYLLDFYREETRLLRESILREKPDVLSAQWSYEHAWGALQTGIPATVTCHDTPFRYAWIAKDWFTTYHLFMAWRVIRKAKRLICVSPYTAMHIRKYFFPRCPVDMIPNGLSSKLFERGERRMANPRNRAGEPFVFCSAGGWGPIKNVSTLLKAFTRVRRTAPDAQLALFGGQLGAGQLAEKWALRYQLHEGVSFMGGVSTDSLTDFFETKADLMVHPSVIETFGMAIVEAIACGIPVIGGEKSGAVPWTLDYGACGYLCDVRDEHALAETMLKAMREPDQNRSLAGRAWKSAKDRFDIEKIATANEDILKQLLR